ncbi:MAG TPA: hypothetical protein VLU43_18285 [Anaeromyxobacteraceae bacterium]|nr:hypothetical protein [Anaeromyxobacteraceae bacterium]
MPPQPRTPTPVDARPPRLGARIARRVRAALRDEASRRARQARDAAAWLWARRPTPLRGVAAAFAAAVAALGVWGILFQAGLPARLPAPLDWAAAAALLARDGRPGDAAVPSPAWAERTREVLPAQIPVLALPRLDREDLVGVRRVWLVALPDLPRAPWRAEIDLLERAARAEGPLRLGAIEVTRYDVAAPALPLAFLPDRLAAATVTVGDGRCAPDPAGAFSCPPPGAARVAREVRDVAGLARPCLVVRPDAAAGAPVTISFADVPMGRTLRGHAAAIPAPPGEGAAGAPLRAPLRLALQIDGDEVGSVELTAAGRWQPFRIDTTLHAGSARAVALLVTAAAPDAPAVCVDLVTLP